MRLSLSHLFLEGGELSPRRFRDIDGPWVVSGFSRSNSVLVSDIMEEIKRLFNVLLFQLLILRVSLCGGQERRRG